jgi:hypothetical protein
MSTKQSQAAAAVILERLAKIGQVPKAFHWTFRGTDDQISNGEAVIDGQVFPLGTLSQIRAAAKATAAMVGKAAVKARKQAAKHTRDASNKVLVQHAKQQAARAREDRKEAQIWERIVGFQVFEYERLT